MAQPRLVDTSWLGGIRWAHFISRSGNAGVEGAASYRDGNQQVFTIQVGWQDLIPAVTTILGTNTQNIDVATQLDRAPPVRHPVLNHLYATRISSIKPIRWLSKSTYSVGNWSTYDHVLLTVLFQQPKYTVLRDDDLDRYYHPVAGFRQEWNRHLEWRGTASSQTLSRPGGNWTYAEGGAGGPTAGTTKVPGSVSQRFSQPILTAVWRNVPKAGLFGTSGNGVPANLLACVGCVNSIDWNGFTAGTLLLDSATWDPVEAPLPASVFDGNLPNGEAPLAFDVTFNFVYFNPSSGGTVQGHNLQPFPGGTGASLGKWWLVTDGGAAQNATGTNTLLRRIDMALAFQLLA